MNNHKLNALDNHAHNYAAGTSTWTITSRKVLSDAADHIENLELELEIQTERARTAELLLDQIYPHLTITLAHIDDCPQDEHGYPDVYEYAAHCDACTLLALIRHWIDETTPNISDREIETLTINHRYL